MATTVGFKLGFFQDGGSVFLSSKTLTDTVFFFSKRKKTILPETTLFIYDKAFRFLF